MPAEVYDADYYEHTRYADEPGQRAYVEHLTSFFVRFIEETQHSKNTDRLLDVGCATGDFVNWALQEGHNAEGIDSSEEAVRKGCGRGLPLRVASIYDLDKAEEQYDIITMWDVLEHLTRPREALERLYCILKPGGYLFLKTVSSTSLLDLIAQFLYRVSLGRIQSPMKHIYVPGHLYYFTQPTLSHLLDLAGWLVEAIEQTDTPAEALFRSRPLRVFVQAAFLFQRWSGRCYELMVVCRKNIM